jgi:hypothetical protein
MSYETAIEWWPIEKIVPYDLNPRIRTDQQVAEIARSIERYGWQNHINVDADGVIVSGHGRRLAALKLQAEGRLRALDPSGQGFVPVKVLRGLTPELIKEFRIADNKLSDGSGWDDALLKLNLTQIGSLSEIDIPGFTSEELAKLLDLPEPDDIEDGIVNETGNPKAKSTVVTVGEYRIKVPIDTYNAWLDGLRGSVGFEKEIVHKEIARRLGFDLP